jgi:hypothetical protein
MRRRVDIPGYEGFYTVSDAGIITALPRKGTRGGAVSMKLTRDHNGREYGYAQVCLWKAGKRSFLFVHRIVLAAFVGPPLPGWDGCHLNDDPNDNRVENLMWGPQHMNRAGMKLDRAALAIMYIDTAERMGVKTKITRNEVSVSDSAKSSETT